jgi:hypothetical protein
MDSEFNLIRNYNHNCNVRVQTYKSLGMVSEL